MWKYEGVQYGMLVFRNSETGEIRTLPYLHFVKLLQEDFGLPGPLYSDRVLLLAKELGPSMALAMDEEG